MKRNEYIERYEKDALDLFANLTMDLGILNENEKERLIKIIESLSDTFKIAVKEDLAKKCDEFLKSILNK